MGKREGANGGGRWALERRGRGEGNAGGLAFEVVGELRAIAGMVQDTVDVADVLNCGFYGNRAELFGGGAVLNNNSTQPRFTNCVFSGNGSESTSQGGGAVRNENSQPLIVNCTFYGNAASSGGGVFDFNNSISALANCILWGNRDAAGYGQTGQIAGDGAAPAVNFCDVQGWDGTLGGVGNMGNDPHFLDPNGPDGVAGTLDDNLRLAVGTSPCVNAGDNPKIGLDWMGYGQQKEVLTPGRNEKCCLAGALNAVTGELTWVDGERKNSLLIITLLQRLLTVYPDAPVIHMILDNYRIHSSHITRPALAAFERRIVLHFLPPHCPNENRIERLWQDLHAAVTRNHRCRTMSELMHHVYGYLQRRQRQTARCHLRPAA